MTDTQASALEKLERRTPLPRVAELLAGTAMPATTPPAQFTTGFTTEIPAFSPSKPPNSFRTPGIAPLPATGTLRDAVSSAMTEPPVAMPAPVIIPMAEEPFITKPIPLPKETPLAKAPVSKPPTIKNKPVEAKPAPPSPFETGKEKVPPSFTDDPKPLPRFEKIEKLANDAQLVEALLPIVETSLEKALYAPKTGLHMYLEPMLRATVRRAIAEQMETMHHFGQISMGDRIAWRLKALFTSRTYDDLVFERTHRYRVEEVYLLRYQSNSLISYASHDPSRHATTRKIKYDLSRLVVELQDEDGELRKSFKLPNHNTAAVRCGQNCFLLASVKGPINALVRADLDYVLTQVEQRFGERLRDQGQHFVQVLQPLLEGCLLIKSPPGPR